MEEGMAAIEDTVEIGDMVTDKVMAIEDRIIIKNITVYEAAGKIKSF
jgi:hypothetical protein